MRDATLFSHPRRPSVPTLVFGLRSTRKRFFFQIFSLCLMVSLHLACRSKTVNVREDLLQYLEKARLWAATEGQINRAIASVRIDQFVHDDFVKQMLKPAIDIAREHVQQLEQYQPKSPPLINVHQEYIEAWRAHHVAMATIIDSVDKKDYIQLAKANNDLIQAQRSVSDALADLTRLSRAAGIQSEPAPGEQPPPSPQEGFSVTPSSPQPQ